MRLDPLMESWVYTAEEEPFCLLATGVTSRENPTHGVGDNMFAFVDNNPVGWVDGIGMKKGTKKVKKCRIVIYVTHNSYIDRVVNPKCSAASVIACKRRKGDGPIEIDYPIPGWKTYRKPAKKEGDEMARDSAELNRKYISPREAGILALQDFDAAVAHAQDDICKDEHKCCKDVHIEIVCYRMGGLLKRSMGKGICGKSKRVPCR